MHLKKSIVLLEPVKLFKIPGTGSNFYISARIDKTTVKHILAGIIGIFNIWLLIGVAFGKEISDGEGTDECIYVTKCKQGFDIIDFLAFFVLPILIGVLF